MGLCRWSRPSIIPQAWTWYLSEWYFVGHPLVRTIMLCRSSDWNWGLGSSGWVVLREGGLGDPWWSNQDLFIFSLELFLNREQKMPKDKINYFFFWIYEYSLCRKSNNPLSPGHERCQTYCSFHMVLITQIYIFFHRLDHTLFLQETSLQPGKGWHIQRALLANNFVLPKGYPASSNEPTQKVPRRLEAEMSGKSLCNQELISCQGSSVACQVSGAHTVCIGIDLKAQSSEASQLLEESVV